MGVLEEPRTWSTGRSLLGPIGLGSSCLTADHWMVTEKAGFNPTAHSLIPRFFLHSNLSFQNHKCSRFKLENTMLQWPQLTIRVGFSGVVGSYGKEIWPPQLWGLTDLYGQTVSDDFRSSQYKLEIMLHALPSEFRKYRSIFLCRNIEKND